MQIVRFKKIDIAFQIIAFLLMIVCWKSRTLDWDVFALFIVAIAQSISSIFWMLTTFGKPKSRLRQLLNTLFPIAALVSIVGVCGGGFTPFLLYIMLIVGPVLGISYFILTVQEVALYRYLVYRDAI